MSAWQRGQFVELDGLLAVVVGIEGDPQVPEHHVALWFGDPHSKRTSAGGRGGSKPEIWTVSTELCIPVSEHSLRH